MPKNVQDPNINQFTQRNTSSIQTTAMQILYEILSQILPRNPHPLENEVMENMKCETCDNVLKTAIRLKCHINRAHTNQNKSGVKFVTTVRLF